MTKFMCLFPAIFMLLIGCAQNDSGESRSVHQLPYEEMAGTLTQYKNFIRGDFALSSRDTYTLSVLWHEGDSITLYCIGENGHEEELEVANGSPITMTVPEDGFYRIKAPLNGDVITGFAFNLCAAKG